MMIGICEIDLFCGFSFIVMGAESDPAIVHARKSFPTWLHSSFLFAEERRNFVNI
jgi:hypothetical protein